MFIAPLIPSALSSFYFYGRSKNQQAADRLQRAVRVPNERTEMQLALQYATLLQRKSL